MRLGLDVCCICGSPALPLPPSAPSRAWLSRCRVLLETPSGYLADATDPGPYLAAGCVATDSGTFLVNWGVFHAAPPSTREFGLPRPCFLVHDACWQLLSRALPPPHRPFLPRFFAQVWQPAHERWTYGRRRGAVAKTLPVPLDSPRFHGGLAALGTLCAGDEWGGGCAYLARLGGAHAHWLGWSYPDVLLADPTAAKLVRFGRQHDPPVCRAAAPPAPSPAPASLYEGAKGLPRLPFDVLERVAAHLDAPSFGALRCTCRALAAAAPSPAFWSGLCRRTWPALDWDAAEAAGDAARSSAGVGVAVVAGPEAEKGAGPPGAQAVGVGSVDWEATLAATTRSDSGCNAARVWRLVQYICQEVVPLRWDLEATRRVNQLPSKLRERVRVMIESFAREHNIATITKAVYYDAADRGNVLGMLQGAA